MHPKLPHKKSMQVLESLAPFAIGFIGWHLSNSWIEKRQQNKPATVANVSPRDNLLSFAHNSNATRVIFEKGAVDKAEAVLSELQKLGTKTVFLLCSDDPENNVLYKKFEVSTINCVGALKVDPKRPPNVLLEQCMHLVQAARDEFGVDCVFAHGGLSVISLAKALNASLDVPTSLACVPTTYSGYEMTNLTLYTQLSIGIAASEKAVFSLVVYDVECTMGLSLKYTTTSIIANIAHIMEAWCSEKISPLSEMSCEGALTFISTGMKRLSQNGLQDAQARYELLVGAWLGSTVYSSCEMGIHHLIVDVLGRKGYKRLALHAILLPYVLQYNLYAIEPQLRRLAAILGTENPLKTLKQWLVTAGVPTNLKDIGVVPEDFDSVVETLSHQLPTYPKEVTTEGLKSILNRAYNGDELDLPHFLVLNPTKKKALDPKM
eukprot:TRINITY_DN6606_c0_g1_i1.p1 TRINITY_DN6606_c0_g1~~TRINITY_DN6606_c0_g1_i1.p1  ORF type:complete len:434 (+),score=70.36 TRINITY_DN6606_c0_g1_i1:155-1456(+)